VDAAALARLTFVEGDAAAILGEESFDAVLVDPMFPPKRKSSALARKDVRLLRAAVGDDRDADRLFVAARRAARIRVAVKRADDSPDIAGAPAPDLRFEGRTARFDVYLPHRSAP
jgi:16S rRNA (guanine1516-N2)-methyltransferase